MKNVLVVGAEAYVIAALKPFEDISLTLSARKNSFKTDLRDWPYCRQLSVVNTVTKALKLTEQAAVIATSTMAFFQKIV
jgi:hypothetical protein